MQPPKLAALTVGGLLFFVIQSFAVAQDATPKPSLVGSWEFTAKLAPSRSTQNEIAGLATFTSDGAAIETDTSEASLRLTPGHGIWQPGPAIGNLFIRFTSLIANPDGTLHSKRIVTMTVELNSVGDQFNGALSFELVDSSGHVITTRSGSVAGQLIVHPLLP